MFTLHYNDYVYGNGQVFLGPHGTLHLIIKIKELCVNHLLLKLYTGDILIAIAFQLALQSVKIYQTKLCSCLKVSRVRADKYSSCSVFIRVYTSTYWFIKFIE